jgi:hypothetical protein
MTDIFQETLFRQIVQEIEESNAWPIYKSDILIYDKVWIFEHPGVPFLFVIAPTGSHLIPLTTDVNVLRYEFIKANTISKLPDNTHFWLFRPDQGLVKLTHTEARNLLAPN